MATLAINLGVQSLGIVGGLLKGHSIRLKDATSENSAASQAIPAFTQDIQEMVTALNNGSIDETEGIAYIQQANQAIYAFLKKQVGPAGTAWRENSPGICDKTCTVGCCLYYTFVVPSTNNLVNNLRAKQYPATIAFSKTNSSKYGYPGQPGFSLTLNPPKVSPLSQLLGTGSSGVISSTATPASSILAKVGLGGISPTLLAVLGLGILAVIAFSQRSG